MASPSSRYCSTSWRTVRPETVAFGCASASRGKSSRALAASAAVVNPRRVTCSHLPVRGFLWVDALKYQAPLASL